MEYIETVLSTLLNPAEYLLFIFADYYINF